MKKLLAIGIIFLFIGIAIAPRINFTVVKASNDNDLVEVTSQACGIQGFGNTTVKLTKEQYQNLEQYLVDFRARLNQTTTREEAVPLFQEAVVELNKYGLLPKGMNVGQAQMLITNAYRNTEERSILQRVHHHIQNTTIGNIDNAFCLVFGEKLETFFMRILPYYSVLFIAYLYFMFPYSKILYFLNGVVLYFVIDMGLATIFRTFVPINIGVSTPLHSSSGHLVTIGLQGTKSWNGQFNGGFTKVPPTLFGDLGMIGFKGIHLSIYKDLYEPIYTTFLGSALAVGINEI